MHTVAVGLVLLVRHVAGGSGAHDHDPAGGGDFTDAWF